MCWLTLFSAHLNNGNRPLSISALLKELNSCIDRFGALVYGRRDRTPDTFNILKQQGFLTLNIVRDLIFLKKQKNLDFVVAVQSHTPEPQGTIENTLPT